MQNKLRQSKLRFSCAALSAAILLFAGAMPPVLAQGGATLKVEKPWARATVAGASVGGGYLTVTNSGAADRLIGVASTAAARTEMHQMTMDKDIMRMREVKAIDVPANGMLELKPGGYHLMFVELNKPFKVGEKVPVTLRFEKAGEVKIDLAVESAGAGAKGEMKHGGMKAH